MELDPAKLNDYPIKLLQNYCRSQNLAVRGTRKNDYVLVILAHLQKTKGDLAKIVPASAQASSGGGAGTAAKGAGGGKGGGANGSIGNGSGGAIDVEAVKRWEAEEQRRREEERVKYEQWRAEEEERKRRAEEEERRAREEEERRLAAEREASREAKRKDELQRARQVCRAHEQGLGCVASAPWTIGHYSSGGEVSGTGEQTDESPSTPPPSPPAVASPRPASKLAGEMRTLHVEKQQPAGHTVRLLTALPMAKRGQRSVLVISKPGLSYVEQLEQAEVWVGARNGKITVYSINMKKLKDTRKGKWKKASSLRVRDEREKQSVRQLVQVGQRVWAMAEGETPAVFDAKAHSQLTLPDHKKGRELLRCLGHTPAQSMVWCGLTGGLLRAYDAETMSLVCEHSIRCSSKKKDDEEERERVNCLLPIGADVLWVGTTKGVRSFSIKPKEDGNGVKLVLTSFLTTDQSVSGLTLSSFPEYDSSAGMRQRVWATTKDSLWIVLCDERGHMVEVAAKMSGAQAFPASGLVEVGNYVLSYGSSLRMVVWGAEHVTYLCSGPDMSAYYGPTEKKKRKSKWDDSLKGMCRGAEFSVGVPTLWTIDDQFLAAWRVD